MKKILTIAGSDCSGGAGIQADIKTICAHKMYAMSAITALTAQNTTGVYGIQDATEDFVASQIDCIFTDIYPDAVKIGMVSNTDIIKIIAKKLQEYKAKNIVMDPVMVSTSGSKLLNEDAVECLKKYLMPLATVITPNLSEAEIIYGKAIKSQDEMQIAAKEIGDVTGGGVLIKGGHLDDVANDLLYHNGVFTWFNGQRVNTKNTHGTGCTLSSAIACNLATGATLEQSVDRAKEYITGAINSSLDLGKGCGPLNHLYNL